MVDFRRHLDGMGKIKRTTEIFPRAGVRFSTAYANNINTHAGASLWCHYRLQQANLRLAWVTDPI